ncbi:hypothetical protein SAY87_021513 [Trapa incisa]|uniref:DNA (cytosine-5-)-methyltransferase n=1 Tax=Trapa incisa TaxID=236973 RepID=A0AAN7JR57_9MYRT|nr:hypothetical protein SAY87_021513 [Trapa incisa]
MSDTDSHFSALRMGQGEMGGSSDGGSDDNIDWNTEDEIEIEKYPVSCCSREAAGPSNTKLFDHFVGMGFSEKLVSRAINENGQENTDLILESLLTYAAIEDSPQEQQIGIVLSVCDNASSDYEENLLDDSSDFDSDSDSEGIYNPSSEEKKMTFLTEMGYTMNEASIAMERCGADASEAELADFICAHQMSKAEDALLPEEKPLPWLSVDDFRKSKKRKFLRYDSCKRNTIRDKKPMCEDDEPIRLPNPMVGFGLPTDSCSQLTHRNLPEPAIGPPYFYYENVALAPKGVWDTISRFLYDVEPEFVDSKYFCACARKRGYVHNLPIHNRCPLRPIPPLTISEALPMTKRWWPNWDTRTKLNCIQTCVGSAKLTERIRKALEDYDGEPPLYIQNYVLNECRKWNLVWVGRNKLAPLEPDEVEMLLGFPRNHTRGGGISRTDRYKSLGNSFQVDTVAYHLSVLKDLYPGGISLLSLFSGIGGAEVALYRLGIPLKNVVSVEISEVNRTIVRCWWDQTNQKGNLIDFADIQQFTAEKLEQLISAVGGFDLVVGGSPCNNLAGSNRYHRDGLEGKESSLFYHYFRVLDLVKSIMSKDQ